jgi:hypothetical protein
MGVSSQFHAPGTHWTCGWVCCRMGLGPIERKIKKFLPLPGIKPCFLVHTTLNMIERQCVQLKQQKKHLPHGIQTQNKTFIWSRLSFIFCDIMGTLMYVKGVHRNKYTSSGTVSILFDFIQIWIGSPISHIVPYYKILWSFNEFTLLPSNAITILLL